MLLLFACGLLLAGCESSRPAARTGEALDRAGSRTGEAIGRAGDWVRSRTQ